MLLDFGCALVGRSAFVVLLCRDLTSSESRFTRLRLLFNNIACLSHATACDRHDMLLNSKRNLIDLTFDDRLKAVGCTYYLHYNF